MKQNLLPLYASTTYSGIRKMLKNNQKKKLFFLKTGFSKCFQSSMCYLPGARLCQVTVGDVKNPVDEQVEADGGEQQEEREDRKF
jgi:hypothetical protein